MKECLTSICTLTKLLEKERNVSEGDVVQIIDTDAAMRQWTTGRVVATYPRVDGCCSRS